MKYLLVFLGGGLGSMLRHGVNVVSAQWFGTAYPVGTLFINVLGSLAMGAVVETFALRNEPSLDLRLLLTTGVLGGFTTFSAFSLETALLHQRGETGAAVGYVLASIVLGVGGLFAGMAAVRGVMGQ